MATIDLGSRLAAAQLVPFSTRSVQPTGTPSLASFEPNSEDTSLIVMNYEDVELRFASLLFQNNDDIYAPPPLIQFGRSKKLITTQVNESDNEVVEHWSVNSWDIRIRGILVDMNNHHYPATLVRRLHKLFNYKGAIEISGRRFLDKDITSIYIRSYNMNDVEGFEDTIQYSLSCRSIKPVTFTLTNPV